MNKIKLLLKEESVEYSNSKIKSSVDIVNLLKSTEQIDLLPEEHIYLICLNTKNNVICYSQVAMGGIDNCIIDLKTIFKTVLLANASRFILVHNHPSGDPTPSGVDIKVTSRLQEACKLMSLELLDHVVISGDRYASCMNEMSKINTEKGV